MTGVRLRVLAAAGISGVAFALYLGTLAPTVTLVDSGELIAAASLLDVAHPPGMPLYVLIGRLFAALPWGSPAMRLNLMSAVFGALTCGIVFLLALEALSLGPDHPGRDKKKRGSAKDGPRDQRRAGTQPWIALVAALCLACSATLWSYATVSEVYTLSACLITLSLLFLLRCFWNRSAAQAGSQSVWNARLAFLFLGLALATHHVSALFLAPGIAYLLWSARSSPLFRRRLKPLVWMLPGLALYAYLPIRAAQNPPLNWGNPVTLERFFWHVTGKQYQSNFVLSWDSLASRGWFILKLIAAEFTIAGLALALLGLVAVARQSRRLFTFLALTACANLACVLVYDISEDNEAYALPLFILFTVAIAFGMRNALERFGRRQRVAMAALTLLPLACLAFHYSDHNQRTNLVARDYGVNALENMAPGSLLLTMDWQLYSPLIYLQNVEGERTDALVIDVNLLRRSWYVERLRRTQPEISRDASSEMEIYREQLDLFEHDRPYDAMVIQRAFVNLANRIIDHAIESRRVYLTIDLSEEPDIARRYFRVPRGPLFELRASKPETVEDPGRFRTGSLLQASLDSDPVVKRLRRNYALMHVNRAIYLTLYGRREEAAEWCRRGLAIDPETPEAINLAQRLAAGQ